MNIHRHMYAHQSDVSRWVWESYPQTVQNEAEHRLRQAILLDGREPHGHIKILLVEGLVKPHGGIEKISPGVCWVPALFDQAVSEWRDERFCDPEFTLRYRITYTMDALDRITNGFIETNSL